MDSINPLYPVFLKAHSLHFLIVGGGKVALEKMHFLFKSSPNAKVTLVSPSLFPVTKKFIEDKQVQVILRKFKTKDIHKKNIVIAATNKSKVNFQVQQTCKKSGILVNVADTPDLCDFYMGNFITKGNLKIGISTNGKSPTMAKRIRQFLETFIPEDTNELLLNLKKYQTTLKGDFEAKVIEMNKRTALLVQKTK